MKQRIQSRVAFFPSALYPGFGWTVQNEYQLLQMMLRANEIFHGEENKDSAYSLISIRVKLRLPNLLDCREKRISKFVNGIIFIRSEEGRGEMVTRDVDEMRCLVISPIRSRR